MKNLQLIWTKYGNSLAIGVKYKGKDKFLIEQIYNLFYNYGITGGALYSMVEGKFGYFLIRPKRLSKIFKVKTELGLILRNELRTNFIREDFLITHL